MGQRLSEARKRRNLTLVDIARSTKIPVHFLEAIERDDVDQLPPYFFARAFVRTYATTVGVNPGELLDTVDQTEGEQSDPNIQPVPLPVREPLSMRPILFAIPGVAACALYYFAFAPTRTPPEAPRFAVEIPIAAADRIEPAATVVPQAASDVELQIQSSGGCIVAATADGRPIVSQVMPPGEPVVLKARGEVVLRVGDSSSCVPVVKPDSPPRSARRPQVGTAPESSAAVAQAIDQQPETAAPASKPMPSASDAVLPRSDQPATPSIEQF